MTDERMYMNILSKGSSERQVYTGKVSRERTVQIYFVLGNGWDGVGIIKDEGQRRNEIRIVGIDGLHGK